MSDVLLALRVAARHQRDLVAAGGYIIGPRGLEEPSKINIEPGCIYGMGASSSPSMVYVTYVDARSIKYKDYPFHGAERTIERWIGEDLMAKGSKTLLHRGAYLDAALKHSLQSTLSGGKGTQVDVKQYEPLTVSVISTVPKGKGRAEDPWYWAEAYGGVAGMEGPGGEYTYEIATNRGGLQKLKSDHRFKVVKVEPRA